MQMLIKRFSKWISVARLRHFLLDDLVQIYCHIYYTWSRIVIFRIILIRYLFSWEHTLVTIFSKWSWMNVCTNLIIFRSSFCGLESSSVSPAQLPVHKSCALSPIFVASPPSKRCSLNAVVLGSKRLPACLPLPHSGPSPRPAEPGTLGVNASILLV